VTQHDINALALDLGITREAWPEYWPATCGHCWQPVMPPADFIETNCNLPAPDSGHEKAVAWLPFLINVMGWYRGSIGVKGAQEATAELYAAYKAMKKGRL
jgi:hypothetical protein